MAFYTITQFFYDSETKNIRIQFALPLTQQPSYPTMPGDIATESFEAELFLDAGTMKIGEYHPASIDGTTPVSFVGRQVGQDPNVIPQNPWPPA